MLSTIPYEALSFSQYFQVSCLFNIITIYYYHHHFFSHIAKAILPSKMGRMVLATLDLNAIKKQGANKFYLVTQNYSLFNAYFPSMGLQRNPQNYVPRFLQKYYFEIKPNQKVPHSILIFKAKSNIYFHLSITGPCLFNSPCCSPLIYQCLHDIDSY